MVMLVLKSGFDIFKLRENSLRSEEVTRSWLSIL